MSTKPETTFITSVHRHLPEEVYHMKNNNPYLGGVPDVWYSSKKGDLWIEYKFITLPKKQDTVIDLAGGKSPMISKLQQEWLTNRHSEGRNVGMIVGCKEGGVWMPGVSWTTPHTTAVFWGMLKSRKELADIVLCALR